MTSNSVARAERQNSRAVLFMGIRSDCFLRTGSFGGIAPRANARSHNRGQRQVFLRQKNRGIGGHESDCCLEKQGDYHPFISVHARSGTSVRSVPPILPVGPFRLVSGPAPPSVTKKPAAPSSPRARLFKRLPILISES